MQLPLFPLSVVLFPGMLMPLHIFEPRYLQMIHHCLEHEESFGVVLIQEGKEIGETAVPHAIGTAARITKVARSEDGRMNITVVGTRRFRVEELHRDQPYLRATVRPYPFVNGDTQAAQRMAERIRPKILRYVGLLAKAVGTELKLARLPEDPTTLAFLTAIALQVSARHKQKLLTLPGVPEMLDWENFILARELQLLQYTLDTQAQVEAMSSGPTGYLFPN